MKYSDKLTALENLGFNVPTHVIHNDHQSLADLYTKTIEGRADLDFEIDGIVIRVNDEELFQDLGLMASKKKPRGAHALKFPAEGMATRLLAVEWSERGSREVCPVGIIETIELAGANISRVSLKSTRWIEQNNIRIGTTVEVVRSGDVIPKIVDVVAPGDGPEIVPPSHCTECGNELTRPVNPESTENISRAKKGQPLLPVANKVCDNPECIRKSALRLQEFLAALKVKGLARKSLLQYCRAGVTIQDFMTTPDRDIRQAMTRIEFKIKSSDISMKVWKKVADQIIALENA